MDDLKVSLKPTVMIYHENEKGVTLRFCSEIIRFDDEMGDVIFFFSLLDGRYSRSQIQEVFSDKYDGGADIVSSYLETVDELHLIENIHQDSSMLNNMQRERFSRNFEFFNTVLNLSGNKFAVQRKLSDSKVAVLGCGGLGSHIILELAALGIGNLTIVDFDSIELSNLNRQILYREENVGAKKVFTARDNILRFNSGLSIKAVEARISSLNDIKNIIDGHDLIICVADKPRNSMVKWLNEACCDTQIPFINGGLDTRRAIFYSVVPGVTGCTECWKMALPDDKRQIIDEDNRVNKDYSSPAPALSALVSVTAGVMVCEAIKILTGIQPPALTNHLGTFFFDNLTISASEEWSLHSECVCCRNISNKNNHE